MSACGSNVGMEMTASVVNAHGRINHQADEAAAQGPRFFMGPVQLDTCTFNAVVEARFLEVIITDIRYALTKNSPGTSLQDDGFI